jgi:hypothetical protein
MVSSGLPNKKSRLCSEDKTRLWRRLRGKTKPRSAPRGLFTGIAPPPSLALPEGFADRNVKFGSLELRR